MEIWSFGTSPHGLGMAADDLWALTLREHAALRKVAEEHSFSVGMFRQLRADIHNAWIPKRDKTAWTPQDFEDRPAKSNRHPRNTLTPEQLQRRVMAAYGPRGKGKKGAVLEMPALQEFKAKGQPLPNKVG